jgi:hypothetical protein
MRTKTKVIVSKDKVRELSYDDILHYQKIIVALTETERIMREIDEVASFGSDER